MNTEIKKEIEETLQRSTFVNVLAWVFIIMGGFTTFISIFQNIMIHTFSSIEEMNNAVAQSDVSTEIPAFVHFMFNYMDLFFLFFLCVSFTSFVSAIALLKRKNWARIIFIMLMFIGIIWSLVGLILPFTIFPSFSEGLQLPPGLASMMHIMQFASVVMAVAFCALFGFVIRKLCSQQIKEEFVQSVV